mgnify:FL=1
MNYTERKAKNQVFFYITSGSGFMTPLISVLIIPGAVSTAVNMVAAMVKRICNGIEKLENKEQKGTEGKLTAHWHIWQSRLF